MAVDLTSEERAQIELTVYTRVVNELGRAGIEVEEESER